MPIDAELLEILACPACKTPVRLVKDGTALKCDACHRVYAIKDDIPVMLLDEADESSPEDPARPPAPGRRRGVHDAGHPRPAATVSRGRPRLRRRARGRPGGSPQPAPHQVIEADRPRGLARLRYDLALARRLRAASYDVAIDFHGGPRSAWLVRASGAPVRIGYDIPGRRWAYTTRVAVASAPGAAAALGPQPVGSARRRSTSAPPTPAATPWRWWPAPTRWPRPSGGSPAAGVTGEHALVVLHVSASNPFRRWPRQSFARVAAALAAADPARPHYDHRRAVGGRRRRRGGGRRGAAGRRCRARPSCGAASRPWRSSRSSWRARGSSSAATPVRCTSRRRRAVPVVALFGPDAAGALDAVARRRRCRRWRWSRARCRAGRATSAPACPATSAA